MAAMLAHGRTLGAPEVQLSTSYEAQLRDFEVNAMLPRKRGEQGLLGRSAHATTVWASYAGHSLFSPESLI